MAGNELSKLCTLGSLFDVTMGVDPWVDRGTFPPYFLKCKGRPVFCPSTFSG